ncbi:TetR/AcrR family transcriptional regulator [cf. Phormidesmis sp. LEGE 11477]|uniref:TetR/AcrR family transcriptional regulator n=1 Tax=cf. Phormidesmis sp. LEGE 11477 TaxID=1828680 RepID=UPI0018808C5D|nr:TetR/AcrR family transcriptional regulator [cf. Phormidesmis sp. LEGE 11477]
MNFSNRSERKKSAVKSAAILQGAKQEFLANGYAATSMDRVAAAAGVSKATVYSHFQDKTGLFSALIQQMAEEKFRSSSFDIRRENALSGEPRKVLTHLAKDFLDEAACDSQFCEFMRLIIGESGRFPELSEPYIQNVAKPILDELTRYLSSCSELGLSDPTASARMFVGTLVYFVMLQRMLGAAATMPIESDRMIKTLVDSIAPLPS